MRRKLSALLLVLLLLFGFIPALVSANNGIYFLAVGNELMTASAEVNPVYVNSITYIPCAIFGRQVKGTDLGVSYGWYPDDQRLTLYSEGKILEFDLVAGTASSFIDKKTYNMQAVEINGRPYVPASQVGNYFDFHVSFLAMDNGDAPLLRLKDGTESWDDVYFMQVVQPILVERVANSEMSEEPEHLEDPEDPEDISPEPDEVAGRIYLAITVDEGDDLAELTKAIGGQIEGIFFFPVEELVAREAEIRALVGNGQKIGLIPQGDSEADIVDNLTEGRALLAHILRKPTFFVLDQGLSAAKRTALEEEGYLLWAPTSEIFSQDRSDLNLYYAILGELSGQTATSRVLLDSGLNGATLERTLNALHTEGHRLEDIRETNY